MADGTSKPIREIGLGEVLLDGGEVIGIYTARVDDSTPSFNYQGVTVTGSHAVFEDGMWVRVKDSRLAQPLDISPKYVYNLATKNHTIVAGATLFADYEETDDPSLGLAESLEKMNQELLSVAIR